jgi:hypothetical protein
VSDASLAHSAEQRTFNPLVVGSKPTRRTMKGLGHYGDRGLVFLRNCVQTFGRSVCYLPRICLKLLEDGLIRDLTEISGQHLTLRRKQQPRWLGRNSEGRPRLAGLVPQELDLRDLVSFLKCLSVLQTVLRAKTNDANFCCVLSSKLLNARSFPGTSASMRRPHPHQYGLFLIHN